MASNLSQKREFLAVYDYGMGGIWYVISARSIEEVQSHFPFFKVFEDPPKFISKDEYFRIRNESFQDIDLSESNQLSAIRDEWDNANKKTPNSIRES